MPKYGDASQNLGTVALSCSKPLWLFYLFCQLFLKPIKRNKLLFKEIFLLQSVTRLIYEAMKHVSLKSAQLSITSPGHNEALHKCHFLDILWSVYDVFAKNIFNYFTQQHWQQTDYFMDNLFTNTIKHVSEMELYNILSNLDNQSESLITKYQQMKW